MTRTLTPVLNTDPKGLTLTLTLILTLIPTLALALTLRPTLSPTHYQVTHTPPHGVLDIVGGVAGARSQSYKGRVGCRALAEMLRGLRRPPALHAFGHVHAVQARGEPPEGPRLCASKHVEGACFANVAAERQLPAAASRFLTLTLP